MSEAACHRGVADLVQHDQSEKAGDRLQRQRRLADPDYQQHARDDDRQDMHMQARPPQRDAAQGDVAVGVDEPHRRARSLRGRRAASA
jgi:hypothetical protein